MADNIADPTSAEVNTSLANAHPTATLANADPTAPLANSPFAVLPAINAQNVASMVSTVSSAPLATSATSNADTTNDHKPIPEFFNVAQACELISKHYDRGFKNLRFKLPIQVVDNVVAEFVDADVDVIVASARIRYRNRIEIDRTNGNMRAEVHLSDLTFVRSELNLTVVPK